MKSLLLFAFLSVLHTGFSFGTRDNFPGIDKPSKTVSIVKLPKLDLMKSDFGKNQKLRFLPSAASDEYGAGKSSTILSLAVPGLGLYRATGSPLMLAFAPVCYGLVGFGAYSFIKGKSEYNNYLSEKNPSLQTDYITSANKKKALGFQTTVYGVGIWVFQTIWTYVYGSHNDKYRERNSKWKNSTALYGGYDPQSNTATLNMRLKF